MIDRRLDGEIQFKSATIYADSDARPELMARYFHSSRCGYTALQHMAAF